ncbi:MAG: cysteine desulfurase family protein [Geminicoccales bacterium]
MTYLDYNASAPMSDAVIDAMTAAARLRGNPSSVHGYGRTARAAIENARGEVAAAVGARPEQVVFTSGATEANAMALRCCGRRRVLVSAVEHDSVLNAVEEAERVPVDADGVVDTGRLRSMLSADGSDVVVSVMLANNETGVVQPLDMVAAVAAETGALVHCDAVQGPGRIPVDFHALGVDFLSLSAHKLGGPKGVGALILRREGTIAAGTRGGGQERGLRGGTENLTGIVGFGAAALALSAARARADAVGRLRDELETRVRGVAPDAVVFGAGARRLPNTACIGLPGVGSEAQVMALDLAGIAISAGSACSSGKIKASHVLKAMGVADSLASCAIRVSLGPETGAADIEAFMTAWRKLATRSRRSAA